MRELDADEARSRAAWGLKKAESAQRVNGTGIIEEVETSFWGGKRAAKCWRPECERRGL